MKPCFKDHWGSFENITEVPLLIELQGDDACSKNNVPKKKQAQFLISDSSHNYVFNAGDRRLPKSRKQLKT